MESTKRKRSASSLNTLLSEEAWDTVKIKKDCSIPVDGRGSHHRRVKSGKSHRWKEFTIFFKDMIKIRSEVSYKSLKEKSLPKFVENQALLNFEESRFKALNDDFKSFQTTYQAGIKKAVSELRTTLKINLEEI